jgi:hypothetical protein
MNTARRLHSIVLENIDIQFIAFKTARQTLLCLKYHIEKWADIPEHGHGG